MSSEKPPLAAEEAERLVALVAPVAADHDLVLIGGQAVAFWQAELREHLAPAHRTVIASKDLDFQGHDASAVRAAAALLGGEPRIPRWDDHSPMIGLVAFKDVDGHERQLDILPSPHGLNGEQVSRDALPIQLSPGVAVRVLHPIDCLASRLANSTLPSKQTDQAWQQLDAAIQIVPAYGRLLLSLASGEAVRSAQRHPPSADAASALAAEAAGPITHGSRQRCGLRGRELIRRSVMMHCMGVQSQSAVTDDVEREVLALGRRLWRHQRRHRRPMRVAEDRVMTAMTAEPGLRAAAFRMVDVAPACGDAAELGEHLGAYLDEIVEPSGLVARSRPVLRGRVGAAASGRAAEAAVRSMADRFIVGESISAAVPVLESLWAAGTASTVDLLGEATVTPQEGDAYARRCLEVLRVLGEAVQRWPARPPLERDAAGVLPRVNLSVKVTALTPLVRPAAPERAREDAGRHLLELLRVARDVGAHLHIDMESFDSCELILELVLELLSREEFATGPSAGIVLQAYLRDSEEMLERVLAWAGGCGRSVPLTVRLVKGAYWDHEVIDSTQRGWQAPVWTEKLESDRCFERLTRMLVDAFPVVRAAIASHNLRSVAHAVAYARSRGLGPADIELQVLRGLGDELQRALAAEGLRCRTYCPVGDLVAGMAYLVRRLLENTANDSFLTSSAGGAGIEQLLARP